MHLSCNVCKRFPFQTDKWVQNLAVLQNLNSFHLNSAKPAKHRCNPRYKKKKKKKIMRLSCRGGNCLSLN